MICAALCYLLQAQGLHVWLQLWWLLTLNTSPPEQTPQLHHAPPALKFYLVPLLLLCSTQTLKTLDDVMQMPTNHGTNGATDLASPRLKELMDDFLVWARFVDAVAVEQM